MAACRALLLLVLAAAPGAGAGGLAPPALAARPLQMSDVVLERGSRFDVMRARNLAFLAAMNVTDVACEFTAAANLTGSFEAPTCRFLDARGHISFAGHFLSATAQLCNATLDAAAACAAGAALVVRLAGAQSAWAALGPRYTGFLFPYSADAIDVLFYGPRPYQSCSPICVPLYIYHKVLAGMLDQALLASNAQAWEIARGMATWICDASIAAAAKLGPVLWQEVLATEFGGLHEPLFTIAQLTGDALMLAGAELFNLHSWSAPLASGIDDLAGQHANTHVAQIVGDARGFEVTGNATKAAIVAAFFAILTTNHSFATGGSNSAEHWGFAQQLGDELTAVTQESCTTYNVLKVTRALFAWSADAAVADWTERALFNGLLGAQARTGRFANMTAFIYFTPLGSSGLTKPWAASDVGPGYGPGSPGLVCCWGTLSETFAKLSDGIFWEGVDDGVPPALIVNLFVAATVRWRGAVIQQQTTFPYAARTTTALTVVEIGSALSAFTIALRVPAWAFSGANVVTLNGEVLPAPAAGGYLRITRSWQVGDELRALFPPVLRFEPLAESRAQWEGVGAILFGGSMLVAVDVASSRLLVNTSDLAASITRSAPPPGGGDYVDLVFTASNGTGSGDVRLMAIADVVFESYCAYFETRP